MSDRMRNVKRTHAGLSVESAHGDHIESLATYSWWLKISRSRLSNEHKRSRDRCKGTKWRDGGVILKRERDQWGGAGMSRPRPRPPLGSWLCSCEE